MEDEYVKEWVWEDSKNYDFVRVLKDGRLYWGGWEKYPKGGGGARYQTVEDFLKNGQPYGKWRKVPDEITSQLREYLEKNLSD